MLGALTKCTNVLSGKSAQVAYCLIRQQLKLHQLQQGLISPEIHASEAMIGDAWRFYFVGSVSDAVSVMGSHLYPKDFDVFNARGFCVMLQKPAQGPLCFPTCQVPRHELFLEAFADIKFPHRATEVSKSSLVVLLDPQSSRKPPGKRLIPWVRQRPSGRLL